MEMASLLSIAIIAVFGIAGIAAFLRPGHGHQWPWTLAATVGAGAFAIEFAAGEAPLVLAADATMLVVGVAVSVRRYLWRTEQRVKAVTLEVDPKDYARNFFYNPRQYGKKAEAEFHREWLNKWHAASGPYSAPVGQWYSAEPGPEVPWEQPYWLHYGPEMTPEEVRDMDKRWQRHQAEHARLIDEVNGKPVNLDKDEDDHG